MRAPKGLVTLAVLGVAGVLVYRFGLSEEARRHLRESVGSVRDVYDSVTEAVDRSRGIVVDEPLEDTKERIRSEWAALGY